MIDLYGEDFVKSRYYIAYGFDGDDFKEKSFDSRQAANAFINKLKKAVIKETKMVSYSLQMPRI